MFSVQEGGERWTISVLERCVARVADANVIFEAHDWNVDPVWRTSVADCLTAVSIEDGQKEKKHN